MLNFEADGDSSIQISPFDQAASFGNIAVSGYTWSYHCIYRVTIITRNGTNGTAYSVKNLKHYFAERNV